MGDSIRSVTLIVCTSELIFLTLVHYQIFHINVYIFRIKFFWGTPSQFGCALVGFGQSVSCVKISGHSTP